MEWWENPNYVAELAIQRHVGGHLIGAHTKDGKIHVAHLGKDGKSHTGSMSTLKAGAIAGAAAYAGYKGVKRALLNRPPKPRVDVDTDSSDDDFPSY